jgi:pyrrolysine biosynthesis protein PylD
MTRLREEDLRSIGKDLNAYDAELVKKTGLNLKGIALRAVGIAEDQMDAALSAHNVAAIPITSGQGRIGGFAETVGEILRHMGASVIRTSAVDVEGMAEAIERGAGIIFLADDRRFIAMNLPLKRAVDNGEATARGYGTALELMAGTLRDKRVLVIGAAGNVGWHAVGFLIARGAKVSAYDPDQDRLHALAPGVQVEVVRNLDKSLREHTIYLDASPAADIIQAKYIGPETTISAPGIPLGVTQEAYGLVQERLIHDPLQIGVATMLAESIIGLRKK